MDRIVRKIDPKLPKNEQQDPQPFSAYDNAKNVVLLGDPGAGKTYAFRDSAKRCGGRYITARAFLNTPADKSPGTLFIDGLDEKRGGRTDRDTIDSLVQKLFVVSPDKVRISCRAADWLGETDIAALNPYFEQSEKPVVLLLDQLTGDEQRAILQAEGLSAEKADTFLREAKEHSLNDFLGNPQNLVMLLRAFQQAGTWPATRKELFELSTQLMLKEFDVNRARSGSGAYTVEELRPAAGAICAARLISDIEAISLTDHEDNPATPSYRSLSMIEPEKAAAALSRRVFITGPVPESVDYAHRTTAEYLGAAWLADEVRRGMPFGRVQALLGVDGHPSSELRGLHAWLAVHLPEHANSIINADPYGILTYGDAASLTKSACACLIKSLARLDQTDPWFRSGKWDAPGIAGLSRPDMVDEFRTILYATNTGFGVRSIVLEAVAFGVPLPELKDDLVSVITRDSFPFSERLYALIALLRIGPDGNAAAEKIFPTLGADSNSIRLRAQIIHRMYGAPCGPADVATLLRDIINCESDTSIGILYPLYEKIPFEDIPTILNSIPDIDRRSPSPDESRLNRWEIGRFIDQILTRAWQGITDFDPAQMLRWLELRSSYLAGYGRGASDDLRSAILEKKDRLFVVTDNFLSTFVIDDDKWFKFDRFRKITLMAMATVDLLKHIIKHLKNEPSGSAKRLFFYETAFGLVYSLKDAERGPLFEELYSLGNSHPDLRLARDALVSCKLPTGHPYHSTRDETKDPWEENRKYFEQEIDTIRNGSHLGWLGWAAQIYYGLFYESDQQAKPRERLVTALGDENAAIAIEGFIATLSRQDLPSLSDVVASTMQRKRWAWWFALTAGLAELENENLVLDRFSSDFLKALIVFDLINPVFERGKDKIIPKWKTRLMQTQPELVLDAYLAIARAKLESGDQHIDGLHELMTEDELQPFRGDAAIQLLYDFPNANPYRLCELIDCVLALPAVHAKFLKAAEQALSGSHILEQPQRDKWIAAAYLLAPEHYQEQIEKIAEKQSEIVFDLRDLGDKSNLTLPQLEFLVELTATYYSAASHPQGGWSGNTNEWDASDYCRSLIDMISAIPSQAASEVLTRLEANPKVASYRPHLRHALASQQTRRREAEYDRPDWPQTIRALSNGEPATVSDLHALLLDQLDDLRKRIAHDNTDIYRKFWNIDGHSKLVTPRPENDCRDTLVMLLRPTLTPKNVMIEPEGQMAADKRADISAAMPGRKVLCELKRDYHAEIWTAAEQQLERFYAHDPEAQGFGIYCVLWFGEKRTGAIPKHPDGLPTPTSATELEKMLRDRAPVERRHRIAVLVIDVTGPL